MALVRDHCYICGRCVTWWAVGVAGNNCVLFTANDAYMRDFKLFIPSDCVVSNSEGENRYVVDNFGSGFDSVVVGTHRRSWRQLSAFAFGGGFDRFGHQLA